MHANRTDGEDASPAFRARIARDNAMDVELYEFARELVAQRSAHTDERSASSIAARHAESSGY